MLGSYLDKFRCRDCGNTAWSVGALTECPMCGGRMQVEVMGTERVPEELDGTALTISRTLNDSDLDNFFDDLERWRDEE